MYQVQSIIFFYYITLTDGQKRQIHKDILIVARPVGGPKPGISLYRGSRIFNPATDVSSPNRR